ncbi:hypothetical protein [Microbacterium invictum]|uniref:Uncharacterized protein n=1 Tax=Microbacterium invictum TaxID=515415 RepID=A0AA40SL98_9MICO|nr:MULTISPECIES: hypothetical protein [Microbacterium]MBB4138306.1 hypothetical protein [Microbacterium invictum]
MSQVTLVPAVYRCPDHDNHETVTARVRERVEWEIRCLGAHARPTFRVAVTCPGNAGGAEHRRLYDGEWQRA